jgi:hypothetical protein
LTETGVNGDSLRYSVTANPGDERTGKIAVTAGTVTDTFTVTQAPESISLSPTSATPTSAAQTLTGPIVTTSYGSWTAAADDGDTWITDVTASGNTGETVGYAVTENPSSATTRTGKIIITSGDHTATFTVTQGKAETTLSLSPTSATPAATAQSNIDGPTVTTNYSGWTAVTADTWITGVTAEGTSGGSVKYSVTANPSSAGTRAGKITVSANGKSADFTLTQAAAATTLTHTPTSATHTATAQSNIDGPTVTTNYSGWTAATTDTWISGVTASGTTGGSVKYSVAANPSSAGTRAGKITISANGESVDFSISQAAAETTLSLSPTSTTLTAGTAQSNIDGPTVTTNYSGWTAESKSDWITGVTASGSTGGKVSYTVAANTGAARSGTITVSANGKTANFTVTQPSGQPTDIFEAAGLLVMNKDQPTGQSWYVYSNTPSGTNELSDPPLTMHAGQIPSTYNTENYSWTNLVFAAATQSGTVQTNSCAAIVSNDSSKPWRLPTIRELTAIYAAVKSDLNAHNFLTSWYWSASAYNESNTNFAWCVIFMNGYVSRQAKTTTDNHDRVRCVRSK